MNRQKNAVPVVTIDGPSGAGKGTVCRLLAQRTGYHLLDSGSLYRLTALSAMRSGIDLSDMDRVAEVAQSLKVRFDAADAETAIYLAGDDVTAAIRREEVGMSASKVAAYQPVRAALLGRQRAFARAPGLVADGRDMGTVVFPDAEVKVFLTASAEERANRRFMQLQESGETPDLPAILADIRARDDRDSQRATAPLVAAPDALMLDSTDMSIEQVLDVILAQIAQKSAVQ